MKKHFNVPFRAPYGTWRFRVSTNHSRIEKYVGKLNVDVLSGWEAGIQGKERISRMLNNRLPPAHLSGPRLLDWIAGRDGAARLLATRLTFFMGSSLSGDMEIKRKGWVSRWPVIHKMGSKGFSGDVRVYYMEDGEIVRQHDCCI